MKLRGLFFLLFGALAGAGCLPDPEPVDGKLIHAGIHIEKPGFELFDGEPWVTFGVRKSYAQKGYGSKVDLYRVRWVDGQSQVIVADYADRDEWRPAIDAEKIRYYMKDERETLNGGAVGTLNRVSLTAGVVETIPDVISFGLNPAGTVIRYYKYVPGSRFPELWLRDLHGHERSLGMATGQVQFTGDGRLYYIDGEDHVLKRLADMNAEPQVLRSRVSRFQLRDDQLYAVMAVSEMDKVRTLVVNLETKEEIPSPVENPCCWMSFGGNVFQFSESAAPGRRAALHSFDFMTRQDTVLLMPEGLAQVGPMLGRPNHKETLIFDTQNRMGVYRPDVDPEVRLSTLRPVDPVFSEDGRFLLYIEPDPPPPTPTATPLDRAGRLLVVNADDYESAPRELSPHGASVPISPRGFFTSHNELFPVVFWAHYGFGASDLYFANHETGMVSKVADGISEVTVTQRRVVGIVRVSLQDFTGDLVQKDLMTGLEQVMAFGVSETAIYGNRIAFLVRDRRNDSPRNGLWGTMLPELGQPAGMVMAMPPAPGAAK